jgi:hypothetical protein
MYTPSRRLFAATAALSSALFLAGCASDDDDPIASPSQAESASPSPSATASVGDFCNAKVAIDAAFLAGGPPEDEEGATPSPEQVGQGISAAFSAPYAEMQRTAQPDVKDAVNQEVDALNAAISSGDGEFFFKPDFVTADKTIDDYLSNQCGYNKISATAQDYEYSGLPTESPAGLTGLTLTNEGKEFHEMVLARINDDVDESVDEILGDEDLFNSSVVPQGVVLASPGTTATNFFDIKSGRYIVLCVIGKGSDAEHDFNGDGPPHFTLGMHEELRVLPGPGEATAEPTSSSSSDDSSSSTADEESASPSSTSDSSSTSSDDVDEPSSPEPTSSSS